MAAGIKVTKKYYTVSSWGPHNNKNCNNNIINATNNNYYNK